MKRQFSDSSDQSKNAVSRRSRDQNSTHENESSSSDNPSSPEEQVSSVSIASEEVVPSTSVQSFATSACPTPSQIMMQNQMMMYNTMRNYQWPDSYMYNMATMENVPMSSLSLPNGTMNNSNTDYNPPVSDFQIQMESNSAEVSQPLSPSLVMPYSDEEAASLTEKLRNADTFSAGLHTLTTWLSKSEFNRSNSSNLFSLIQCAQVNIWRLMNGKASCKEEFNVKKRDIDNQLRTVISQYKDICKVFETAKMQKVWDQFTKAQKKQMCIWMNKAEKMISSLSRRIEGEIIYVDDDSSEKSFDERDSDFQQSAMSEEYQKLRENLDSLQNEIKIAEDNNVTAHEENAMFENLHENDMQEIEEEIKSVDEEIESLKSFISTAKSSSTSNNKGSRFKSVNNRGHQPVFSANSVRENGCNSDLENAHKEEVHLISLIGNFLNVHPFGSSIEYICSYLENINIIADSARVENLMSRFPKIFMQVTHGEGASLTKEWFFIGLDIDLKDH